MGLSRIPWSPCGCLQVLGSAAGLSTIRGFYFVLLSLELVLNSLFTHFDDFDGMLQNRFVFLH